MYLTVTTWVVRLGQSIERGDIRLLDDWVSIPVDELAGDGRVGGVTADAARQARDARHPGRIH